MKKLLFLIIFIVLCLPIKAQKPTIIYLVRHAEKVMTDPTNKDPFLTEKGDRKSTRLNSSHLDLSRMPSSA